VAASACSSDLELVRLVPLVGAEPVVLIRYTREAYFGRLDHYARVAFDRVFWGADWGYWGPSP